MANHTLNVLNLVSMQDLPVEHLLGVQVYTYRTATIFDSHVSRCSGVISKIQPTSDTVSFHHLPAGNPICAIAGYEVQLQVMNIKYESSDYHII